MTNACITATWYKNIEEIDCRDWDRIQASGSILKSHTFSKVVEISSLEAVDLRYLGVFREERLIALVSCFLFKVDIVLLAPKSIRNLVDFVRKIFPKFLHLRLFFIGSPIATCDSHIAMDPSINREEWTTIGDAIFTEISKISRSERCLFTLVKEIPETSVKDLSAIFKSRFRLFPSLPTSRVPLLYGDMAYPSTLRRSYRKRFRMAFAESDREGYDWQFLSDYEYLSEKIHSLYLQVYEKSGSKFEKLTNKFFSYISKELPHSSELLTCTDRDGELVAIALLLFDNERLIPLYLGMDYRRTEGTSIYYNIIFRAIQRAENLGKRCVVLGQNSYEAKAKSGAIFESLFLGVHSEYRIGQSLIRWILHFMFKETSLPSSVHTDAAIKNAAFESACKA